MPRPIPSAIEFYCHSDYDFNATLRAMSYAWNEHGSGMFILRQIMNIGKKPWSV